MRKLRISSFRRPRNSTPKLEFRRGRAGICTAPRGGGFIYPPRLTIAHRHVCGWYVEVSSYVRSSGDGDGLTWGLVGGKKRVGSGLRRGSYIGLVGFEIYISFGARMDVGIPNSKVMACSGDVLKMMDL
jgi:hypothetical protein